MNRSDILLLNDSIRYAGDSVADRNRYRDSRQRQMEKDALEREMLNRQESHYQEQTGLERGRLEEQQRHNTAVETNAGKPKASYKWTSGGVVHESNSFEDWQNRIKQFPADPDMDGGSTLVLEGTNEQGVTTRQTIKAPKDAAKNPETAKSLAEAIASFAKMSGSSPKAKSSGVDTARAGLAGKLVGEGDLDASGKLRQFDELTGLRKPEPSIFGKILEMGMQGATNGVPQAPQTPQGQFKSADEVKAAFQGGKLDRESAKRILQEQFGLQ